MVYLSTYIQTTLWDYSYNSTVWIMPMTVITAFSMFYVILCVKNKVTTICLFVHSRPFFF